LQQAGYLKDCFPPLGVYLFTTAKRESQRFGVIYLKNCEHPYPQTEHLTGVNSTNTSKKRTNMVSSQGKRSIKKKQRRPENWGNDGMCITTQRRGESTRLPILNGGFDYRGVNTMDLFSSFAAIVNQTLS
jgi:hypothetical protein